MINFLPWRETKRHQQLRQLIFLLGAGIILIIFGCLIWRWQLNLALNKLKKSNQTISMQLQELNSQHHDLLAIKNNGAMLTVRLKQITQFYQNRNQFLLLLQEISAALPPGIYLTEITKTAAQLTITGVAHDKYELGDFTQALNDSASLKQVVLDEVKNTEQGTSKFIIQGLAHE